MIKNKKVDIRMDDDAYDKLLLLSWFFFRKRSDYVRKIIDYYYEYGEAEVDGVVKKIPLVLEQALKQLEFNGMTMDDIRPAKKDSTMPEELEKEIKEFANVYAKEAKKAYKKHFGEGAANE